ncbi:MAG: hypothetical protein ACYDHZ_00340 [Dehalococcoidia bacterium]
MNWNKLKKLEPRLQVLYEKAKKVDSGSDEHFCANDIWFRQFKPELSLLVGWYRENPPTELQTEISYDIAYQTIYDQLTGCRRCGCL